MPVVEIQGVGRVQFPDDMTPEQITQVIETEILPQRPQEPAPSQQEPVGFFAGLKRDLANPRESLSPENLGRAVVTTSRDYLEGIASVLGLPVDAVMTVWNLATGRNDPTFSQVVSSALDEAGVPQTENPYIRAINRAVAGAGGTIAAGRQIAGAVGEALSAAPGRQVAGAVTGATAAQGAADIGFGPVGQTVAGIVGGASGAGAIRPMVAEAARRSVRGGEAGRQRVAENIATFEGAAGRAPTMGQATQNRRMQAAESLLSRTPGGAGVMAREAADLSRGVGQNLERLASQLAPRASAERAGRAIQRGISGEGGFIERFKAQSKANYDQLDRFVSPEKKFTVSETQKVLEELTEPIKGAERTSQFFINSKIRAIKEALDADLEAGGNLLPYEAVKKLRTIVGEQLADAPFAGDVPRSQWKRLYAALSEDLERNVKTVGPEAERALARANRYYEAGVRRLDTIASVIDRNGGPEAVFRAAISGTKEGATTLRAVMQSLPKDAQRMLSASVIRRLGRATPGRQDDLGEQFSTETFLTNWNSLSPEAKRVLFDRYGEGFRADMDRIAKLAANLREGSAVFRNPSGTAQAGIQYTTVGAFVMSVMTGNFGAAGAIAGGAAMANVAARLLTHPPYVRWMARATQAPIQALPAMLNQLAQSNDPIMREAYELLSKHRPEQSADDGNRR